jgi:hypothetical protein
MAAGASTSTAIPAQRLDGKIKTDATVLRAVAVDRGWADVEKVSKLTSTPGKEGKEDFVYEAAVSVAGDE